MDAMIGDSMQPVASDEMVFGGGFGGGDDGSSARLTEIQHQLSNTNEEVVDIQIGMESMKVQDEVMQAKIEAAKAELDAARAKKDNCRSGIRSHQEKYARDEQLLSNLKFEIDELTEEMESTKMNIDQEMNETSELQSKRVDGELQLSKLEAEIPALKERLEKVKSEKEDQRKALDEQEVNLDDIEQEKKKLQESLDKAKEERTEMREQFNANLRAHREGLASQRAAVQEQKQEQEKINEERAQMKEELEEVMRDLKKEKTSLKKMEYATNNAKLGMMQEAAHLKAAKARRAQVGGGPNKDDLHGGFDDLMPMTTGGTMSSMMSDAENLNSEGAWDSIPFEAPGSGFGQSVDPFDGDEFDDSDGEPIDLMSQISAQPRGRLVGADVAAAEWVDDFGSPTSVEQTPEAHAAGWGDAFDAPFDDSPPKRTSPSNVPPLAMDRIGRNQSAGSMRTPRTHEPTAKREDPFANAPDPFSNTPDPFAARARAKQSPYAPFDSPAMDSPNPFMSPAPMQSRPSIASQVAQAQTQEPAEEYAPF